jgi:hypothetical protein
VLDGSDQQNNNRTSHRKKRRGWPLRPAGCIRLIYTNVTYLSTQICYTTSELRGSHRMAKTGCTHGWASHHRVDGLGPQRDHAGPAACAPATGPRGRGVRTAAAAGTGPPAAPCCASFLVQQPWRLIGAAVLAGGATCGPYDGAQHREAPEEYVQAGEAE